MSLGTVFRYCKSYGAVRCSGISYGAVLKNMKSYGAVRCCDISYGAVRCAFQKLGILRCGSGRFSDIVNPSLRFGAVIYRTVRSARFPVERFFCSAAPLSVGKTVQHRFSPRHTVWINRTKPRFRTVLALFLGARTKPLFFCCFFTVHRINNNTTVQTRGRVRFSDVFLRITSKYINRQSHEQQQVLGTLKNILSNRFNKSIPTYLSSAKDRNSARCTMRPLIIKCAVCFMKGRMHGRYTTWLSGASYMFPDSVVWLYC